MVVDAACFDDVVGFDVDVDSETIVVVVNVVAAVVDSESDDVVDNDAAVVTQIGVFVGQQIVGQVVKQFPSLPSSRMASHSKRPIGNGGKSPDKRLLLTCTTPN